MTLFMETKNHLNDVAFKLSGHQSSALSMDAAKLHSDRCTYYAISAER